MLNGLVEWYHGDYSIKFRNLGSFSIIEKWAKFGFQVFVKMITLMFEKYYRSGINYNMN